MVSCDVWDVVAKVRFLLSWPSSVMYIVRFSIVRNAQASNKDAKLHNIFICVWESLVNLPALEVGNRRFESYHTDHLTTICIQGESYASLLWPVSSMVEQSTDNRSTQVRFLYRPPIYAAFVYRLGHSPFTWIRGVRLPYAVPIKGG